MSARVRKEFAPVALEVEDEEELGQLKSDTNYVDSLSQKGPSRVKTIDERHNKRKVKKVSEKKANNYERKLDYRCEGKSPIYTEAEQLSTCCKVIICAWSLFMCYADFDSLEFSLNLK